MTFHQKVASIHDVPGPGGKVKLLTLVVASTLSIAPQVHAQLDEIIVTARKRQESIQDIPVVVNALSAEQLTRNNIASIETISAYTPQFVVARGSTGNGANLSIRGIGSNLTSIGIEQSVSVNVDGVYQGQGRVLNESMFDMSQVEILKGPQALFFGKNATAGVVSLTTADPGSEFEAMARVGYENTAEEAMVEGFVSGPISDSLSMRLALRYSDMRGGLVKNQGFAQQVTTVDLGAGGVATTYPVADPDNDMPGTERLAARYTALYEPSDSTYFKLKAAVNESEANSVAWANELWLCPFGTSQLFPGAECDGDWKTYEQDLPAAMVAENPLFSKHGGKNYEESDSFHLTGIFHHETSDFAIDWVNGWQSFDSVFLVKSDVTPFMNRGTFAATDTTYEAASSELRLQSTFDSPFNIMGGLYYQESELTFQQDIIFPGTVAGLRIDSSAVDPSTRILTVRKLGQTDGETFAAFSHITWEFAPDWDVTLGGRYTHETKDSTYTQPYVIGAFRGVFRQFDPNNPATSFAPEQSWDNFSPELMFSWRPHEDLLLFAGYKTGYKSGGFSISALNSSGTVVSDLAFEPEEAEGFEAGLKSTLLDNQLRLGVSLYAYEYTDLQVDFFDSARTTFVTFNAGTAETRGVEVDAEWAPKALPDMVFRASVSGGEAFYSSFPGAPCYAGQAPAMGCLAPVPGISYPHQNLKNVDTALAPSVTASLGADYETELSGNMVLGLSAYLKYSDEYNLSPFGNPVAVQDSYVTFDASVRLGSVDDRWQIALIGKNLTDEYILTYAQDAPSTGAGTGTPAGVPADQFGNAMPPRTVAAQITLRF